MRQRRYPYSFPSNRMTCSLLSRYHHLLFLLILTFTTSFFVGAKKEEDVVEVRQKQSIPQPQPSFVQLAESQLGNLLLAPPPPVPTTTTTEDVPTPSPISSFLQLALLPLPELVSLQQEEEETRNEQIQLECPSTLPTFETFDEFTFYYALVLPPTTTTGDSNNKSGGILCARLEVTHNNSNGWIGFAISSNGQMSGSTAIIGIPSEEDNTVQKYNLYSYGANLSPQQTLRDTSLTLQEDGTMIMTFTKLLNQDTDEEVEIQLNGLMTNVLFAKGSSETLGFHEKKISGEIQFDDGIIVQEGTTATTPPPTEAQTPPPTSLSPTSFSPTNLLTFEQARTSSSSTVPNCYIYSMSKVQCEETTNCEYTTDINGYFICQTLQVQVDNCYILSTNYNECLLALNCQWSMDNMGQTICSDIPGYTSRTTPVDNLCALATKEECKSTTELSQCEWDKNTGSCVGVALLPSPNSFTTPTPSTIPTETDLCLLATKEECKSNLSCLWDKNSGSCVGVTLSPSATPTPTLTPTPTTNIEITTVLPKPTIFGKFQLEVCTSSTISKEECKSNLLCEWDKQDNVCIFSSGEDDNDAPDDFDDDTLPTFSPSTTPTGTDDNAGNIGLLPEIDCSTIINKDACNEDPFCFWNKGACQEATLSPTFEPITLVPSKTPTNSPIEDGVTFNCTSPAISKESCKDAEYCIWDKNICLDATPEPSLSPTTSAPTPIDCLSPNITQATCKTHPACMWNKYQKVCEVFSTDSPTRNPTKRPTERPTLSPTEAPKPTSSPSNEPSVSTEPSWVPSNSPTISAEPSISIAPTAAPTVSHYPTMSGVTNTRTKLDYTRYTAWNDLSRDKQVVASNELRYTKDSWDNVGTNYIERLRYKDLSDGQKEAAALLGFDDEIAWNCWQNHYESFSWKQLASLRLTPHLSSLGWDMTTWNAQYNEPTTVRKIPKWVDLSEEQRDSAIQLCYYKTSWEKLDLPTYGYGHPIAKPATRFVEWKDVNSIHRSQLEQNLGYNELTWNVIRLNDVEQKGWFELFNYEKDTASAVLGMDESSWDCWINHYDSYGWNDLVRRGLDEHWIALGYSELSWNEEIDPPASDNKSWDELNEMEQRHAMELCFNQEIWDKVDLTTNESEFPFPKPVKRYTVWKDLTDEERQIAKAVLLYDEESWNDMGVADIERRAWDDLTQYQQPYAILLGMYERTWDCFQNHYRSTNWNRLPDELRDAAAVLGWDERRWSIWGSEPSSYERKWSNLNDAEKEAANLMCHHDVTWPGDGSSINLANQHDSHDGIVGGTNQAVDTVSLLLPVVLAIFVTAFFV